VDEIKFDFLPCGQPEAVLVGMMNQAIMDNMWKKILLEITDCEYTSLPWYPIEIPAVVSCANMLQNSGSLPGGIYTFAPSATNAYNNALCAGIHSYFETEPGVKVESGGFGGGSLGEDTLDAAHASAVTLAITGSPVQQADTSPTVMVFSTNALWLQIQGDPAMICWQKQIFYSTGPVESAMIRPLGTLVNPTSYAVALWNFSATNFAPTLYATDFGWPSNTLMVVQGVFTNTAPPIAGQFSWNVPPSECDLLKVSLITSGTYTTNYTIPSGATLYITNGIIMGVH
jgi:hypothetical protein